MLFVFQNTDIFAGYFNENFSKGNEYAIIAELMCRVISIGDIILNLVKSDTEKWKKRKMNEK